MTDAPQRTAFSNAALQVAAQLAAQAIVAYSDLCDRCQTTPATDRMGAGRMNDQEQAAYWLGLRRGGRAAAATAEL